MAIFSYNVLLKTEKMEIIKQQFASISTDKSIQVLLLTWGFGGLLEAMAGFGTAVAIPAAILISLGFKPIFSATVSLIANSVATAFGAIGSRISGYHRKHSFHYCNCLVWKADRIQRRKSTEKPSEGERYNKRMEYLSAVLISDYTYQPSFSGITPYIGK